ncbi:MAG: hypothetical protein HN396_18145 [Gemmatimonadales bacterium]|nr:hypothetical protein [Gemmatimonadales bacterium]
MSERCYMYGQVRRADLKRLQEIVDFADECLAPDDDDNNSFAFVLDQAPYTVIATLRQACTEGLVFAVYRDSIGAEAVFSDGGQEFHYVDTDSERSISVSLGYGSPTIDPACMERAVRAWHAERRCYKIFGQAEGPT